jgi:photosystem II stability/assembly factor-like uncharacterized protein
LERRQFRIAEVLYSYRRHESDRSESLCRGPRHTDRSKTDNIYAIVDHFNAPGDLLFKSTDGGGTWNPVGLGLPESHLVLAIDPQNPSILYAATNYGIFKSTDGGAGWSPVNSGLPPFPTGPPPFPTGSFHADSVVIDPQQPATVYATITNSSGSRVFDTRDGGASWSDASTGLPGGTYFRVLTIDARQSATLYVGTDQGVFGSSDGGRSWTAANSGLTAIRIRDLVIDPEDPSTLYAQSWSGRLLKTTDRGATWSSADSGLAFVGGPLAIDPQDTTTIFAAANAADLSKGYPYGIYKSTDGGGSWSPSWIRDYPVDYTVLTTVAVDPLNSNVVYATTENRDDEDGTLCDYGRLRKSVDGGITWSASLFKDLDISSRCVSSLVIDPQHPGNLYVAFENGGVFKSTDTGTSWSSANSGLADAQGSTRVAALALDPRNSSTLYAVSSLGSGWGVFKSNDAGASWTLASSGLPLLPNVEEEDNCCYQPLLAIDPTNLDRVYLGALYYGWSIVFKSDDGGASWTDTGLAVPGNGYGWFGGLAVSSQFPGTVYAGTPAGVFREAPDGRASPFKQPAEILHPTPSRQPRWGVHVYQPGKGAFRRRIAAPV